MQFTINAAKIENRLWIMAIYLYHLGTLFAFVKKQLVTADRDGFINNVQQPDVVLVIALAGCVFSGYGIPVLYSDQIANTKQDLHSL